MTVLGNYFINSMIKHADMLQWRSKITEMNEESRASASVHVPLRSEKVSPA